MKNPEKLKWKCCELLCDEVGWKYKIGVNTSDGSGKGDGWRLKTMTEKPPVKEKKQQ